MPSRAEVLAVCLGGILVTTGAGSYSWPAGLIVAGLLILLVAVWPFGPKR